MDCGSFKTLDHISLTRSLILPPQSRSNYDAVCTLDAARLSSFRMPDIEHRDPSSWTWFRIYFKKTRVSTLRVGEPGIAGGEHSCGVGKKIETCRCCQLRSSSCQPRSSSKQLRRSSPHWRKPAALTLGYRSSPEWRS